MESRPPKNRHQGHRRHNGGRRRRSLLVTLIRHGQSVTNKEKRFGGQNDIPLSDIGKLQARLTADALVHSGVTRILSSTLCRAHDTAKAIGERLSIPVEGVDQLRERDVGVLSGLTFDEARVQHPDAFRDLMSGDPRRRIGGGESYAETAQRVDAFLHPIFRQTEGHLIIVSHMVVLTHLMRKAFGIRENHLRGKMTFSIENCALHRMSYDRPPRNHWHVFSLNDTSHLRSVQASDSLQQPE